MNEDLQPAIQEVCVSNVYVRMLEFDKNDIETHKEYPFDHLALLTNGSAEVKIDGMTTNFFAPKIMFIPKNKVHSITALEEGTLIFCIHAIRNGEKIEDIVNPTILPDDSKSILEYLINNDMIKYVNG